MHWSTKKNCYFVAEKNSDEIKEGIFWMLDDFERNALISKEIKEIANSMYDVKFMLKNYLELYNES